MPTALVTIAALAIAGCGAPTSARRAAMDAGPTARAPGHAVAPASSTATSAPAPIIAIDTHVDTTQRILDEHADLGDRLDGGHLDLPRMREGGLTGAFFSVWVDPGAYRGDAAWDRALALTNGIREIAARHPDRAALCTSAAEVRRAAAEGKIAVLIGVEGGHALGGGPREQTLARLGRLHALGARYMTITWMSDNALGHSSTGAHPERGLTPLGRDVVLEMNRLGMIVDVSHVSDRTFEDILDVSRAPVLASHSSARALADHPRNMTDAMIRRVAERGGAVCVNFFPPFIDARSRARPPGVARVVDHIAHIVAIGGPGAACTGSDFDGVPAMPIGLEDASKLPALRAELERRALPTREVLGENVLRVLDHATLGR